MIEFAHSAVSVFHELGSVEEMRRRAARGAAPRDWPGVNAHVHLPPNFSAFDTVAQAVALAREQNVRVLCASNYYDFGVFDDFAAEARRRGVFPLFGTEIISRIEELLAAGVRVNDPNNPGRMYLCGKGIVAFSPPTKRAAELLGYIRASDEDRLAEMVARMNDLFAARGVEVALTERAVKERIVRRHGCRLEQVVLQERHVAQAFQEAFFARVPREHRATALSKILGTAYTGSPDDAGKVQGEIRSRLLKAGGDAFVAEQFVNYSQARELILQLGGIPCYPTLADGAQTLCEYETPVEALIGNLQGMDVHMAEWIPIRNTPATVARYVPEMRAAGIAVAAGTEHNTLDCIPLEPTCRGGEPLPENVKNIFREGACVIAAHQFLTLHGECGYVDAAGNPNPNYATAEERIRDLAKLGAAVIERYLEVTGRQP